LIVNEFDNKKKELDAKYDRSQLKMGGDDENQNVETWVPGTKAKKPDRDSKEAKTSFMIDVENFAKENE